jgi:hypothetical protein
MVGYQVTRRQTTFWELRHDGGLDRIHFHGKEEFAFVGASAASYSIIEKHAVLIDYAFAWENIYIARPVAAPEQILMEITAAIDCRVEGWRSAARYLNAFGAERVLRDGFGQLLAAPIPIADVSKSVLGAASAQFTSLPGGPSRWPRQALIAGPNFVVARSFRVEHVT